MTTIIASISLWVFTILGYVIWNLFQKNKKLEQMVLSQQFFINGVKDCMKDINKTADQIDAKIWVQSDPEFLLLMESVKEMQTKMNQFIEE
jgi:hypothetical protein